MLLGKVNFCCRNHGSQRPCPGIKGIPDSVGPGEEMPSACLGDEECFQWRQD